jgi:ADP-ribose pyrophosphatase YjhB (NUDIX family)
MRMNASVSVEQMRVATGRYIPAKLSASLLLEHDDKLMMVQEACERHRGKWSQPQGMIDSGELPEQAAVREAKEETGLHVRILGLYATYICPESPYLINFCFRARPITLEQGKLFPDILQAKWFSREQLVRMREEEFRSPLTILRLKHWCEGKSASRGFVEIPPLL